MNFCGVVFLSEAWSRRIARGALVIRSRKCQRFALGRTGCRSDSARAAQEGAGGPEENDRVQLEGHVLQVVQVEL